MIRDWIDEILEAKALVWASGFDNPATFDFQVVSPDDIRARRINRSKVDRYTVVITCDGVTRRYEGGDGRQWLAAFEQDLDNGWADGSSKRARAK